MRTSIDQLAVDGIMCGRCEARPGDACITVNGHRSKTVHSARTNGLYASWRVGYSEGAQEAIQLIRRYVERLQNHANLGDPYDQVLERLALAEGQYK